MASNDLASEQAPSSRRWLVIAVSACVALLATAAALAQFSFVCRYPGSGRMYGDMQALVSATQVYRSDHAGCPTVEDLMRAGIVERSEHVVDTWDNPLEIVCTSDQSWVESAGPDEVRHTEDDIDSRTPVPSPDGWRWR